MGLSVSDHSDIRTMLQKLHTFAPWQPLKLKIHLLEISLRSAADAESIIAEPAAAERSGCPTRAG
jgi:hypothetical protein